MIVYLFIYIILFNSNYIMDGLIFNNIYNRLNNNNNIYLNKNIKNYNKNKFLVLNKKNKIYDNKNISDFIINNLNQNNVSISISPGGVKGFYLIGTCSFIKKNYNLDNYLFTGASAGSWTSLIMSYKGNYKNIINIINQLNYENINSIYYLQLNLKKLLLNNFNDSDFDFNKIFIGVKVFHNFRFKTFIYSDFDNLEDAINCCIASSHIPFITGKLLFKYKNNYCFDGAFSTNPYFNFIKEIIHITPNIWTKIINNNLFSLNKVNFIKLFYKGYNDAKNNLHILNDLII